MQFFGRYKNVDSMGFVMRKFLILWFGGVNEDIIIMVRNFLECFVSFWIFLVS